MRNVPVTLLAHRPRSRVGKLSIIGYLHRPMRLNIEAYAKVSLKKYRPIAARNEDKKVFSGLL